MQTPFDFNLNTVAKQIAWVHAIQELVGSHQVTRSLLMGEWLLKLRRDLIHDPHQFPRDPRLRQRMTRLRDHPHPRANPAFV